MLTICLISNQHTRGGKIGDGGGGGLLLLLLLLLVVVVVVGVFGGGGGGGGGGEGGGDWIVALTPGTCFRKWVITKRWLGRLSNG